MRRCKDPIGLKTSFSLFCPQKDTLFATFLLQPEAWRRAHLNNLETNGRAACEVLLRQDKVLAGWTVCRRSREGVHMESGAAIDFASSANLKQRAWHAATLKHPPSSTHAARAGTGLLRVPRQIFAFCALANKLSTFQRSSYSITEAYIIQILCLLWAVHVNTSQQSIYTLE